MSILSEKLYNELKQTTMNCDDNTSYEDLVLAYALQIQRIAGLKYDNIADPEIIRISTQFLRTAADLLDAKAG